MPETVVLAMETTTLGQGIQRIYEEVEAGRSSTSTAQFYWGSAAGRIQMTRQ
jgi:hypothetical protein